VVVSSPSNYKYNVLVVMMGRPALIFSVLSATHQVIAGGILATSNRGVFSRPFFSESQDVVHKRSYFMIVGIPLQRNEAKVLGKAGSIHPGRLFHSY